MKTKKLKKKRQLNKVYSNSTIIQQLNSVALFLFVLFLPTQLGKHFFFDFSYVSGIRVDYLAPTIYLTDILAFILFILNFKILRSSFLKEKKVLIALLLLFINVLFSQSHFISLYRYIKIAELLVVYAIFKQSSIPKHALLSGLLLGGIFELSLTAVQFVNKHSLQGIFYFLGERTLNLSMPGIAKASLNGIEFLRPYGTFSHPNSLAGFYLLLYFFVLTAKNFPSSLAKNLFLFICTCLIFISFSKLAIFIFLLLNLFYLWNNKEEVSCRICTISRFVILTMVSLIFVKAETDPLTLLKRYLLLGNSLQIIGNNLLLGVGLGSYITAQGGFNTRYLDILNQPVHNIFLLFVGEVGVVLSAIFVFMFVKPAKTLIQASPYVFIALFFTGAFDHYWLTLQQNFLLTGVVFGIISEEG